MTPRIGGSFRGCAVCIALLLTRGLLTHAARQSANGADIQGARQSARQTENLATNSQRAQPGATITSPATDKPAATAAPAQQTSKPHKVMTNDDLKAFHTHGSGRTVDNGIFATGECDDDCAHLVREEMGFDEEQDGDWQFRLAAARRGLAMDSQWKSNTQELRRVVQESCNFQHQIRSAALPSGSDWNSGVERARREEYEENMGRVISQGISSASARIDQSMNEIRNLDPVRVSMMNVLRSRVLNSCADSDSR